MFRKTAVGATVAAASMLLAPAAQAASTSTASHQSQARCTAAASSNCQTWPECLHTFSWFDGAKQFTKVTSYCGSTMSVRFDTVGVGSSDSGCVFVEPTTSERFRYNRTAEFRELDDCGKTDWFGGGD